MSFKDTIEALQRDQKKVLVVGLGISGIESAKFLGRVGISVLVCERQTEEVFRAKSKYASALPELSHRGVRVYFGVDGEQIVPLLDGVGLAVLSPGVPLESAIVGTLSRLKIPWVSELELGIELHGGDAIVVTGSNGKSTTVSLLDHVLREAGIPAHLCGNVGTPVIANEEILGDSGGERSHLVVEASSYQLEACTVLKPVISILLNISENHLERHGTIERYAAAKSRALALQDPKDMAIVNADDPMVMGMIRKTNAFIAAFGQRTEEELRAISRWWARLVDTSLIRVSIEEKVEEYSMARSHLLGLHNRYNSAAVILAARRLGVSREVVQRSLDSFAPLEHRLEPVANRQDFLIFNDSKSTTVAASMAAFTTLCEHYPKRKITLMLGGLSKAGSWEPLLRKIKERGEQVPPVICFGKDGPLLAGHCKAAGIACRVESSLRAATQCGISGLREDREALLLLSPGCASFDEFSDFEHRGAEFKSYVHSACV